MVDAFATADDLAARLNRTFTGDEEAWVTTLLEDASTYLRGVIGYEVTPQTQSTFIAYPDCGRVEFPQVPVVSVDSVQRAGVDVDYSYRPYYLDVRGDDPVDVQFTWGSDVVPPELTRIACVLVSSALLTLEANIGLTAGGLSSVALDDFKLAWADAGAGSGMVLPSIHEDAVRRQFGKGDACGGVAAVSVLLGALGLGRAQANARMTETVIVTEEVPGDPDPVTLEPTVVSTTHYTGPARVKYPPTRVLQSEQASQFVAAQELEVHFPSGSAGIARDYFVTVTASVADSGLVGHRYRLKGFGAAGQTTALRIPAEEVS